MVRHPVREHEQQRASVVEPVNRAASPGRRWPGRLTLAACAGLLLVAGFGVSGPTAPGSPAVPLDGLFALACATLLALYALAQRGRRPLLRFVALVTLLGVLAARILLWAEPGSQATRDGAGWAMPLPAWLDLAVGGMLAVHWLLTRARLPPATGQTIPRNERPAPSSIHDGELSAQCDAPRPADG